MITPESDSDPGTNLKGVQIISSLNIVLFQVKFDRCRQITYLGQKKDLCLNYQKEIFYKIEFRGPYGFLRNSSPYRRLARFAA